jgi:hypothetical protein
LSLWFYPAQPLLLATVLLVLLVLPLHLVFLPVSMVFMVSR